MTFRYFTVAQNWWGPDGMVLRIGQHLGFTLLAMAIALALALPVAIASGHTGRFGFLAVNVSNIGRAVPSIAFLGLFSQFIPHGYSSIWPTVIALVALAIPPLVTNTYVGVRGADPDAVEAARGMGLSPWQVALRVEFPLALPLVMAGVRTSVTNVVATASLAALVGQGGLGRLIIDGQANFNVAELVAGAVLIAVLAIVLDRTLAALARRTSAVERAERTSRTTATGAATDEGDMPVDPSLIQAVP
ncbi:MAG: binding-protein-dependent transport system inner rane component [Frankiales bacterium]|nr:binding-protein-dependent transport system inner rane component [Frankiales bacterium]